jgi:serine/threonine protein kinase
MSSGDAGALDRAMALFDALVDLEPAEREARLAELRQQDPAAADALAGLLAADAEHSGVLDHGVKAMAPTLLDELGAETAATQRAEAGRQIGEFQLLRPLGEGGMGEVWLAQRRGGEFVQDVALKLLKRGMDSELLARRFLQERRILAELSHPHIARFIDGGISEDGRLYYAMEYVDGIPITDYVEQRGLGARACVRLMVALCEAVAHAQSHLIVHRDIKPSNVLIDAGGQPRVLDFGIAKLLDDPHDDTALTATGMRLLSPAYAAPEQALNEPISTATDVYSLGVLLYRLLVGELPHLRSGSLLSLAEEVRRESTTAPSVALRRQLATTRSGTQASTQPRSAREIAGDLDLIVLTAMHREPARRYANATAMALDLQRWLEGRPISAQADTAGYRMRKFVSRNRLAVGSASAILLALVAGMGIALWQAGVAREQAELARSEAARAEHQTEVANEALARSKRVKEFMMQTFVQADTLRRSEGAPMTVAEAFEDALARIDSELTDDPKLQVDLLDDFSEIRAGQGRFDEARELVTRALTLAEQHYPPDHPVLAESLNNRSVINSYSGGSQEVIVADVERALRILETHPDAEPLNLANVLGALASVRAREGNYPEMLAASERALDLWRQHGKATEEGMAVALHNTATALLMMDRYDESEARSLEAIEYMTALGGAETPRLEPLMSTLSQVYYQQGRIESAIEINARRLRLFEGQFDVPHPWMANVLTDIGSQAMEARPELAREYLERAIAMFEALDSQRILIALRYRALLARDLEGPAAAQPWFERALRVCAQGKGEPVFCHLLRANQAGVLAELGDGEAALRQVDAAIAALRESSNDGDNKYPQALESRALAQRALGEVDAARATQQEAIERYLALYAETHPEVQRARKNLAKL